MDVRKIRALDVGQTKLNTGSETLFDSATLASPPRSPKPATCDPET